MRGNGAHGAQLFERGARRISCATQIPRRLPSKLRLQAYDDAISVRQQRVAAPSRRAHHPPGDAAWRMILSSRVAPASLGRDADHGRADMDLMRRAHEQEGRAMNLMRRARNPERL